MKWLGYVGTVVLLGAVGIFLWYLLALYRPIQLTQPVTVVIPEQVGTEGVAVALFDAGIIRSRLAFIGHVLLTGQRAELKTGTYNFQDSVTTPLVLSIVTKHQSFQGEVEITLLEGWTAEQMGEALAQALPFTASEYVTAVEALAAEGYLFPDTYRFFKDATVEDVITKQRENFDQKFTTEMKQVLEANGRTVAEAVVLASIVEKEAQTLSDKQLVAGVFWKRIDNGMPLQSDVTINYITKNTTTTVTQADLDIESAYNTYRNQGLPPSAISNPGYDALYAVVYPTLSDYWYFIATPEGEVLYSTTYEEHLTYKAQYYP